MSGILYIVATPIGNLEDITLRALKILKSVDFIAAEDTRHSKKLLSHFNIAKPIFSFHEQNERVVAKNFLTRLEQGESLALISDAGTPLINDPGYYLVKKAHEMKIQVVPIPGPCAAIAALSASGLASDRFIFEGFLPAKAAQRKNRLDELRDEPRTLIFYESPHRILDTLSDMLSSFGDNRYAVIARELTKIHETIYGTSFKELIAWLKQDAQRSKGEFVVLVQGQEKQESEEIKISLEKILKPLISTLPIKQAVEITATITGVRKNKIYQLALTLAGK